jgi:exosome complex component RRP40
MKVALFHSPFRYQAEKDDFVIATLQGKSGENYFCDVGDGGTYVLNGMDFEGATKKNRPNLNVGAVLYTRVVSVPGYLRGRISCINPKSKKEWV